MGGIRGLGELKKRVDSGEMKMALALYPVSMKQLMDMVPVGNLNGSSSTYYTDMYWISTATVRVVYRGYSYANAVGGVSNAYANNDASYTLASVGSRLAFRGKIVRAQSVAAYKAMFNVKKVQE